MLVIAMPNLILRLIKKIPYEYKPSPDDLFDFPDSRIASFGSSHSSRK